MLFLLNGQLSHGYYVSPTKAFKCKLPGGVLSRQLHIWDQRSPIGETVTFNLGSRLLWRVEHLRLNPLKLDNLGRIEERRQQLEKGKENYFEHYLLPNLGFAEIKWERYEEVNGKEVLISYTYMKSDGMEGTRELLFSVDGSHLNVLHHAQNISETLEIVIAGSLELYESCEFR